MLQFGVAKELGMTLQQLNENISLEELLGWAAYFSILNQRQEQAMKANRSRR